MSWTDTAAAAVKWPLQQVWGAARNIWRWLTVKLHPSEVVYPALWTLLVWLADQVPRAAGGGEPGEQIQGSAVLALTVAVSTWWTGAFMIVALAVLFAAAAVGLLRMIPAVNDAWTRYVPWHPMSVSLPE